MSKLNCSNCKYYDFSAYDGVDWCKLNHEETGICGYCDREFEDLEEAITHYDAIVEENNIFLTENSKMTGELKDLQKQLAEKEKEIAYMTKQAKKFNNDARKYYEDAYCNDFHNQDKISFCIEQLEKVKELCREKFNWWENSEWEGDIYDKADVSNAYFDIEANIEEKIKQLKGE